MWLYPCRRVCVCVCAPARLQRACNPVPALIRSRAVEVVSLISKAMAKGSATKGSRAAGERGAGVQSVPSEHAPVLTTGQPGGFVPLTPTPKIVMVWAGHAHASTVAPTPRSCCKRCEVRCVHGAYPFLCCIGSLWFDWRSPQG